MGLSGVPPAACSVSPAGSWALSWWAVLRPRGHPGKGRLQVCSGLNAAVPMGASLNTGHRLSRMTGDSRKLMTPESPPEAGRPLGGNSEADPVTRRSTWAVTSPAGTPSTERSCACGSRAVGERHAEVGGEGLTGWWG